MDIQKQSKNKLGTRSRSYITDLQKQAKSKLGAHKDDIMSRYNKPTRRKKQLTPATTLRKYRLGGLAAITEVPLERDFLNDRSFKKEKLTYTSQNNVNKLLDEPMKPTYVPKCIDNDKSVDNKDNRYPVELADELHNLTCQQTDQMNDVDLNSPMLIRFDSPEDEVTAVNLDHRDVTLSAGGNNAIFKEHDAIADDEERKNLLITELKVELQKAKSRCVLLEDSLRKQKRFIDEIEQLLDISENESSFEFIDDENASLVPENRNSPPLSSSSVTPNAKKNNHDDDDNINNNNVDDDNDDKTFCNVTSVYQESDDMLTELRANITFLRTPRVPPTSKSRFSTVLTPRSMSYCVQEQFKKLFE